MKKKVVYNVLALLTTGSLSASSLSSVIRVCLEGESAEHESHQTIEGSRQTLIKKFLDEHPQLNNNLSAALIEAASLGNKDMVILLLAAGVDINATGGENGGTALMYAAFKGYRAIVDLLLSKGADVTLRDKNGSTALIWAAISNYPEIVELLLEKGADINARNKSNSTALIVAAASGRNPEIVKLLLEKGADINAQDKYGCTALIWASQNGYQKIVDLLLRNGADVNVRSVGGYTALMLASQKGHSWIVDLLLRNGADVNVQDTGRHTALIWASQNGYLGIVDLLLRNGADVNVQSEYGNTALMLASESGYQKIVDLLLRNGADVNVQNRQGETALMLAGRHRPEITQLLQQVDHLDDLIAGRVAFSTVSGKDLLDVINTNKKVDSLFQLYLQRTISLLKKYETNTNSTEYRNAARILYTFARRIAQDYIKALGTKAPQGGTVLPHELEVPIFVASHHPSLAKLSIANASGQVESFVNIVEESINKLRPK